jgi:hypothetical protein
MVAFMNRSSLAAGALLMMTPAFLGACFGSEADDHGGVGVAREESLTANALTANALTANALTANALTANALTANALTANALTANALTAGALTDPDARSLLKYVVGCALPAGSQIDLTIGGVTYSFEGQLGLAARWGKPGGSCDASCRAWVSGCVLSRVNHLGVPVPISVRGENPQLSSTLVERQSYPRREATYYGDVFSSPQKRYACLSPGATADTRVCGSSLDGCVMTFVGACDDACDGVRGDGSFPNCRSAVRDAHGHFPPGASSYPGSVTVFLQ